MITKARGTQNTKAQKIPFSPNFQFLVFFGIFSALFALPYFLNPSTQYQHKL
jgi:hypothetical protein